MGKHIRIRVAEQALFVRDLYAAEDEPAADDEPVHIITMTNPHHA